MLYFLYLSQFFLLFSVLVQLIHSTYVIRSSIYNYPIIDKEVFFQVLFILIIVLFLFLNLKIEGISIYYNFIFDKSTNILQAIITLIAILVLPSILVAFRTQKLNFVEYFSIFLCSLLSMQFIMGSYSLLSIFVALELQSLCFYILASFNKNSCFSTEAGLKYFIISAVFSGFFLLGVCIIYLCFGTVNLNEISLLTYFDLLSFNTAFSAFVYVGVLLVTFWFFFKLACAPFHFWAPDVYEGSPLSTTIIFSVLPKFSTIFFFIKWIFAINILIQNIEALFLFFGVLSCGIGTFLALYQKRLKKMIIYSSIAQVGFICCSISLGTLESFTAVFIFLIIYIMTSIILWNNISLFYSFNLKIKNFKLKNLKVLHISDLNSLFQVNKGLAFSLLITLFSISGVPPLLGFYGKFVIFCNLINRQEFLFAVVLLLISTVSVFYYLRIIKILFFETKNLTRLNSKNEFQTTSLNFYSNFIYFINSIILFFLIIGILFPENLFLLAKYIVLGVIFY